MTHHTDALMRLNTAFEEAFTITERYPRPPSGRPTFYVQWPAQSGVPNPKLRPFAGDHITTGISSHDKVALALCARGAERALGTLQEAINNASGTTAAWTPQLSVCAERPGHFNVQLTHHNTLLASALVGNLGYLIRWTNGLITTLNLLTLDDTPRWWRWGTHTGVYAAKGPAEAYLLGAAIFDPDLLDATLRSKRPKAKGTVYECFNPNAYPDALTALCASARRPWRAAMTKDAS